MPRRTRSDSGHRYGDGHRYQCDSGLALGVITRSRRRCGENSDGSDEMDVLAVRLGPCIHDNLRIGEYVETVSDVTRSRNNRSDEDIRQLGPLVCLDNKFVSGRVHDPYVPEDKHSVIRAHDQLERLVHVDSDAQFGRALRIRRHCGMMARMPDIEAVGATRPEHREHAKVP